MSSWSSAMHFVSETSIIIVSVMHRLTMTAKLDSSPHLIYSRHRTLQRLKPKPNTYEGDPSLSVGSFDCGGQNQNSELHSIMGKGRKAPIHKKSGTNLVSTTATLCAACFCCQAVLVKAHDLLSLHMSPGKSAPLSKFPVLKSLYV